MYVYLAPHHGGNTFGCRYISYSNPLLYLILVCMYSRGWGLFTQPLGRLTMSVAVLPSALPPLAFLDACVQRREMGLRSQSA